METKDFLNIRFLIQRRSTIADGRRDTSGLVLTYFTEGTTGGGKDSRKGPWHLMPIHNTNPPRIRM